jgi:hypothetical protein
MPHNDENRKPNDIRNYLSPGPGSNDQTPRRRRRIVTSDESDSQLRTQPEVPAEQLPAANQAIALQQHVLQNQNIVQLSSDEDSMYIPLPRPQPAAATEQPRPPQQPRTSINGTGATTPARASTSTYAPHASAATNQNSGRRRTRSQHDASAALIGEAEESTSASHQTSECAESDTHGEDLYRKAIASCRNANKARTQLRAATAKCRVCAKFASFLDHFL